MLDFSGQTVLVLGLGESGLAIARWAGARGARLRVADTRAAPPMLDALRAELPQAQFVAGAFDTALLTGATLLALSPGLSPTRSAAAPLVAAAHARGVPVVGEIELFARALAQLRAARGYAPRVIGITGTNGKTTTARLTGLLVERAGRSVAVAGNISPTALDTLRARLEADRLPAVWVLELSSFQLATTESLACDAAAVLNITQDHLDWHGTMQAYVAAKARIFAPQTVRVLNRDDPLVIALQAPPPRGRVERATRPLKSRGAARARVPAEAAAAGAPGPDEVAIPHAPFWPWPAAAPQPSAAQADARTLPADEGAGDGRPLAERIEAAARERERGTAAPPQVTFGAGAPTQPDEYGLVRDAGLTWLAYAEDLGSGQRRRRAAGELPGIDGQVHVHRLMPVEALPLRGRHNALNALAALALARAIGCPLAPMLHALREYRGEPHRVQPVAVLDGVEFIDDSKGTNVGATAAALEGLGADGRRLLAILGGDGKGQDFAPLAAPLAAHARAVVLIGRDADAIAAALGAPPYAVERAATLQQAVRRAAELAQPGDAVLLSPACASFDMFRNYAHRAEVFVETVRELAAERGQVL